MNISLPKHNLFVVKKQYAFIVDFSFLANFYQPIIGCDAINVYMQLANESDKQLGKPLNESKLDEFLELFSMNEKMFVECRKKLEAIGLMKSMYDSKNDKYYYVLIPAKNPSEIFNDNKFVSLLKKKTSDEQYEILKYLFSQKTFFLPYLIDISESLDYICDGKELLDIDYNEVSRLISGKLKSLITIDDSTKAILDKYSKSLNLIQIVNIISDSLDEINGSYLANNQKLINTLDYYFSVANTNKNNDIVVKRNKNLFLKNISQYEKEQIFKSYHDNSSFDYVRAIVKRDLTKEEYNFINKSLSICKKELINMAFDFYCSCIYTKGKINLVYMSKVIDTINIKGFNTCDDLLHFYDYSSTNRIKSIAHIHSTDFSQENKTNDGDIENILWK
ncbi:MAG: DnaD domain protein [Mycoplasmoidaceae bacterium]|nr:MAG: DnaD domain protein [Mycoplasmoidaceae bacterium]